VCRELHACHPVTSDPDIYRAAKLLIDRYGEDALHRAAERADRLLEDGDMIGAATWRCILKVIEELARFTCDRSGAVLAKLENRKLVERVGDGPSLRRQVVNNS
jgi:hypothetical protein